jgi:hypothetical protein
LIVFQLLVLPKEKNAKYKEAPRAESGRNTRDYIQLKYDPPTVFTWVNSEISYSKADLDFQFHRLISY